MSAFPSVMPTPRISEPLDAPVLRWGVLGPGWIAALFAAAVQAHTGQKIVAVGSRSMDRAAAYARRFGIDRAYGSYAELVADPGIDVVYVASPHSEHRDQALLAIAAGKHILVEKAFTRNAKEAQEVIEAARSAGVLAQEAMWTRFLPHMDVVRQLLEDGTLGDISTLLADHGQCFHAPAEDRLFNPQLAGGALLDLGIYPLSFASFVPGAPVRVTAVGQKAFTGVDGQVSAVLTADSGAQAIINTTLFAKTPTTAAIAGSHARIEIATEFYMPNVVKLISRSGELRVWDDNKILRHDGLCFAASEVARLVAQGASSSPLLSLAESLSIMGTSDEIRRQIGVSYPGE